MANIKVTEEMIVAVLCDPQYTSERQRSLALWPTASGSHLRKFKELRKKYNIPEPEPGKRGKPIKVERPPSTLRYEDIRKDDRLMKGKKRLIVLAVKEDVMLLQKMDGATYTLSRKIFNATAGEYSKVPPGGPQAGPVKTYVDPALKGLDGRKPGMTINPVFEAAVQDMVAQNEAKEQPIVPESMIREAVQSAIDDTTNIKLDLEMESSADPVSPFTREPEGYIDPAYSFDREPEPAKPEIRDYLSDINQLLDILVGDCAESEMAEQTKKLICYKLVIGFKREIGQEVGA